MWCTRQFPASVSIVSANLYSSWNCQRWLRWGNNDRKRSSFSSSWSYALGEHSVKSLDSLEISLVSFFASNDISFPLFNYVYQVKLYIPPNAFIHLDIISLSFSSQPFDQTVKWTCKILFQSPLNQHWNKSWGNVASDRNCPWKLVK